MEFRWKKSPFVIFKMLGLFVNTFTADNKYFLLNRANLLQDFMTQLYQKSKTFFQFSSAF